MVSLGSSASHGMGVPDASGSTLFLVNEYSVEDNIDQRMKRIFHGKRQCTQRLAIQGILKGHDQNIRHLSRINVTADDVASDPFFQHFLENRMDCVVLKLLQSLPDLRGTRAD